MGSSGSDRTGPVRRPRIGLTTYRRSAQFGVWDLEAVLLPASYVDTVWHAGGVPVLLPPVPEGAEEAVGGVDAVVIAGGEDVDPGRYGAQPQPGTDEPNVLRDGWETSVLRAALAVRRPVLGVCRGLQVLNVATGGTLVQHLPDVVGTEVHRPAPGVFGTVDVAVEAGSRLHGLLGDTSRVHCHHHQALDRLGAGLRVVARAEDGTVEAVELDGPGFAMGVQWHPEEHSEDLRLFQALVEEARAHRGLDDEEARLGRGLDHEEARRA